MDPEVEDFVSEPTIEKLLKLKREHLISLMSHYGLVVDKSKGKAQIRDKLISHMVENDILSGDALEYISKEEKSEALMIKEMELEHQKEMRLRELEYEKELEREKREYEKELEREKRESEREQEREKREYEKELKLRELEIMAAEKEKDRVMKVKLEQSKLEHFDASKYVKFVPPFIEKDVDKYFLLFEKVAKDLNWPLDKYTILLQSALKGKASETYTALSPEQTSDYQFVKESILKAYQLIPEAYRQKFRNYKKEGDKTHVEFGREKERLLDRWCASEEIRKDFERLRQMILLEEFKNYVHPAIKNYIAEQKASTLSKAAEMADEYFLSHKHLLQKGSLLNKHFRKPSTQIRIGLKVAHLPIRLLIQNLLIHNLHFVSLLGTQVKITAQHVSIVEKRVMSFLSVLQDKETKRQKARRPSQMLLQL